MDVDGLIAYPIDADLHPIHGPACFGVDVRIVEKGQHFITLGTLAHFRTYSTGFAFGVSQMECYVLHGGCST